MLSRQLWQRDGRVDVQAVVGSNVWGDAMHYLNLQVAKKKARRQARWIDVLATEPWCVGSEYEKKLRRTRVPCSCALCGNPRHKFKGKDRLTLADKRQNDKAEAQIDDCA